MARRGATIRDVAKKAGVSVGTASKAFNQTGNLSNDTRQRVIEAATALHYAPNALIRSLQRGKTHLIGILLWYIRMEVSRDVSLLLLKGISDGIAAAGYDALLYSDAEDRTEPLPPAKFLDGRADGLILGPTVLSDAGLQHLAIAGIPAVVLYKAPVPEGLGSVLIDNASGIAQAIDYLVAQGHRRIAFYSSMEAFDVIERREAYLQGLHRHGIPCDPALCIASTHYHAEVGPYCDRLLALDAPPTALIAADDQIALYWFEELQRRNLRVPEDMSLVGFDDSPAAGGMPGLTTIRQPAKQVGQTAADYICRLICGEPAHTCRTVLPVEFIVRSTTAPPR